MIEKSGVMLSRTGLECAAENLTCEEWERVLTCLLQVAESWQWVIGDWINIGEKRYGESYKRAIELTGKSYQTLRNVASVAKSVELYRRRDSLTWKHHAEVAALPDEDREQLLDACESEEWTTAELRQAVKARRGDVIDSPSVVPRDITKEELVEFMKSHDEKIVVARALYDSCLPGIRKTILRQWEDWIESEATP